MKYIGIIPARYASTRFPGKPLALLAGKPLIQHVYRQAEGQIDHLVVATDDIRIQQAVQQFGGNVVLTSPHHRSGTDRCQEAYTQLAAQLQCNPRHTVVINIQGDEPFIHPRQIQDVRQCFQDDDTQIATLVTPFPPTTKWEDLQNPNTPKVILNHQHQAIYFSRSVIPYLRAETATHAWPSHHTYYKHIGLYAYRADILAQITALPPSTLEQAESLEQLRWLQNGYTIKVAETDIETIGIDTPADLIHAEQHYHQFASLPSHTDTSQPAHHSHTPHH